MISIIAAITSDRALGRNGDLLYHISDDLKRFKALTMGHPIIMGRKTFESFPKGALPGRRNIVITRDTNYTAPGIETFNNLNDAVQAAGERCYIIGGGNIYNQSISLAHELLLTEIETTCDDADTYFPDINQEEWQLAEASDYNIDSKTGVRYRFTRYVRK